MSKSPLDINPNASAENPINIPELMEQYEEMSRQINESAMQAVGIEMLYFRALPHENGEDVIFQTYTLYNVDDCPKSIKFMLTSGDYSPSSYEVDFFGINYNFPLEAQVDFNTWFNTFGKGTMPQKRDIIYIPLFHKVYEVSSSAKATGFMGKEDRFTVQLTKYNPIASRRESEALQDTLDTYTTGIAELFGDDITNEVFDMVEDESTSAFTGTARDEYKFLPPTTVISDYNLISGGNVVAKNYYTQSVPPARFSIEYKQSDNWNLETDIRFLSMWFQLRKPYVYHKIASIQVPTDKHKSGKNFLYTVNMENACDLKRGDEINITNNITGTNLLAKINKTISITTYVVSVSASDVFKLQRLRPDWMSLKEYYAIKTDNVSLFKGYDSEKNENLSIDIINGSSISVKINTYESVIDLDTFIKTNTWVALGLVMGMDNIMYLYSNEDRELKEIKIANLSEVRIRNKEVDVLRYMIPSGYANVTNIRLYDLEDTPTESEIKTDLNRYHTENSSKCIVLDNAIRIDKAKYIGKQR